MRTYTNLIAIIGKVATSALPLEYCFKVDVEFLREAPGAALLLEHLLGYILWDNTRMIAFDISFNSE